ncbi:hypothetical protein D0T49_11770 [Paludibacter sp. 221]|uniref:hypothetical protein n=1 Tax=Paludibacter sp. 221 TaxID=2302939 RepID=UPI0013D89A18|nr:hypothetical protein [Paludibacter sp. 221]NDV47725.1 hypothetical protein [Paludibacter sp. 221]
MASKTKVISIISVCVVLILAAFIYFKFYFVFGEGVKAGELNYLVHKGYVFKTYEGKMIQTGFRGQKAGTIQSYEFEFSVVNKELAEELMRSSGKTLELHYKEYLGALPWRGFSKFVVDSIVAVDDDIRVGDF